MNDRSATFIDVAVGEIEERRCDFGEFQLGADVLWRTGGRNNATIAPLSMTI